MLQGKRFGFNEEVIAETEAYLESKDESFYKKDIEKLEKRWNTCITLEGKIQSVPQEKVRVFSESFKDFYSFLLCPDCSFERLRRNHRFISVSFEVSDITQH